MVNERLLGTLGIHALIQGDGLAFVQLAARPRFGAGDLVDVLFR